MEPNTRTEAQKEASRHNGSQSHGPTTDEGKARSSQNGTRHGLYSSRIVLTNESQEDFDHLFRELIEEWNPVGPTENQLLQDMAVARWKIRRYENMEGAAFDTEMFIHQKSFDECFQPNDPAMRHHDAATSLHSTAAGLVDFYQRAVSRFERAFHRAMRDLERLQLRRLGPGFRLAVPISQPEPAAQPTDPPQDIENVRTEPETVAANGKTYREPEQFTRSCKVDPTKLNAMPTQQPQKSPHVYDFSKCFKPAA